MAEIKLSEVELLLTHDVVEWNRPGGYVVALRLDGARGMYDIKIDEKGKEYFTNWWCEEEDECWT